jgi:hypothetical protein
MCVHLCNLTSSRILRHDLGDKSIFSDEGVTVGIKAMSRLSVRERALKK